MNEMVKEWFKELYGEAAEEAKAAIANERLWANGAETDEEISMHEQNIENYEEYIKCLQDKIESL